MSDAPIKVFREGSISVAVWKNHYDGDAYYSTKLAIRYKDKTSDEWKDTEYINSRDLPIASLLLQRAWNWIAYKTEASQ